MRFSGVENYIFPSTRVLSGIYVFLPQSHRLLHLFTGALLRILAVGFLWWISPWAPGGVVLVKDLSDSWSGFGVDLE